MAVTMSELLGKHDVVEDCRRQIQLVSKAELNARQTAEIIMKDGSRRIFRAKAIDQTSAIREILVFVGAIEEATGSSVMWRLKGDKTYHLGTSYHAKPSTLTRVKDTVLKYFFDLD
jgi:hypothetical protein